VVVIVLSLWVEGVGVMSNVWLDWVGTVAGVLLGIAIPAQEAMRARKAINTALAERIWEATDAFEAAKALAEQAVCALDENAQRDTYFAATYNRSRIEHALKRMDAAANNEPQCAAAFINAAEHARTSTRNFFDRLNAASDGLDVAARSPQTLRRLFEQLTDDLRCLHAAGDAAHRHGPEKGVPDVLE
jgi:hypothetical protein